MSLALSLLRRRHHGQRFVSTASAAASPNLSVSAAKTRLQREFDPDAAISILSSVSIDKPSSAVSSRFALDLTVRRLARSRRYSDIETLIEPRLQSAEAKSNESYLATLILAYGSAGMVSQAIQAFESFPADKTVVSFNALLTACIRARRTARVAHLFDEMSKKYSIEPDARSYTLLSKALFLCGKSEEAFKAFEQMKEKGIKPTTVTYTVFLDALYKQGKSEEADKLWMEMVNSGCEPDLPAHNVKVMYSAIHGKPEDVIGLIEMMESDGVKPDNITYNYLMSCYFKEGRIKEAKELYKGLQAKGCPPNAATYKNLLQKLCEYGDLDMGLEVFKESGKHNKIPDFNTVRLLVEGMVKESKVSEAKEVIAEVKNRFPEALLRGWKKAEKDLGLADDAEVFTEKVEVQENGEASSKESAA